MIFRYEPVFWSVIAALSVSVAVLSVMPKRTISVTFELDNGNMVTFDGDRAKCLTARNAILADDGSTVETTSPWGVKHDVRAVWCVENGYVITEGLE